MIYDNITITSGLLLKGAFIFALLDVFFIPLLLWRIKPIFFAKLKWFLVIISGLTWFGIWKLVLYLFWEPVYSFIFPVWGYGWIPFLFGMLMAGVTLGFWSLSRKIRTHPLPAFLLLSGTWGVLTHLWAITRGLLTQPPLLQGASTWAALLIAFFEYIFYWCIITSLAALIYWIVSRIKLKQASSQ